MAFHVFLFFLLLCLAWLWHLYWLHHNPPDSRVGTIHTKIQRLLKPRTPLDCPACRLSSTLSSRSQAASLVCLSPGLIILATCASSSRGALSLQTPECSHQSSTTVGLDK